MASQAEILQFFEMMADRARKGEFRFVMVGTVGLDDLVRTTVAGMATDEEAAYVAGELSRSVESDG